MTQQFHAVAIIGFSPIERTGLELLLLEHGAAAVHVAEAPNLAVDVAAGVVVVDLAAYDLGDDERLAALAGVLHTLRARVGAARVVGVSARADIDRRHAAACGIDAVVDRDSRAEVLVDAVLHQVAQRRPWAAPTIAALPLTAREREVLERIAGGCTSKVIAASLGISPHTVESHKQRIFRRLGVQNQAQAVAAAVRLGLIEPGAARSAAS